MALQNKFLPPDLLPNEMAAAEIRKVLDSQGLISCREAIQVAIRTGVDPSVVGHTLDSIGIRLKHCQLGLFGFPGQTKGWEQAGVAEQPVADGFEDALRDADLSEGRLTCSAIWKAASRFHLSRIQAGYVADREGFKISDCQLGAF